MIGYKSLPDFIAAALGDSKIKPENRSSRRAVAGPDDFFGGVSFDQAVSLAQKGDTAKAQEIRAETMKAASDTFRIKTARFDPVFRDDGGACVDIARYMTGEPECWMDFIQTQETPRVGLDVVLNIGTSWKIKASQISAKAAEIAGAVLGLQAAGYLVNVYVAKHWGSRKGDKRIFGFPLNVGGSPLNVALMVAVLQPYFFRRVFFSLYETLDAVTRKTFGVGTATGNYGFSLAMNEAQAREVSGTKGRIVVVNVGESIDYRTNEVKKIQEAVI